MKQGIHPEYVECNVRCSCGNTWTTRSTKSEMRVDLCDKCHLRQHLDHPLHQERDAR